MCIIMLLVSQKNRTQINRVYYAELLSVFTYCDHTVNSIYLYYLYNMAASSTLIVLMLLRIIIIIITVHNIKCLYYIFSRCMNSTLGKVS